MCDLSDPVQVRDLATECADVDILINNAALPGTGELQGQDEERIDRVLDVNLRTPIVLTRLIGERMLARGSGHVVFISSLAGKSTAPSSSIYCATKFGLRGFSLGLRQDWAPRGIGVSAVFPGFIRAAGMFHDGDVELPPGVGTRTPDDVARAVEKVLTKDIAELDVAPVTLKAASAYAGLFPGRRRGSPARAAASWPRTSPRGSGTRSSGPHC